MVILASIIILGIFAQYISWKAKLPAILPLIIIGLAFGPFSTLITADGAKLIDPQLMFSTNVINSFVSLAVGIILFEGGLTLKLREVRDVASTVRNLITIGAVITFVGGAIAAFLLLDIDVRLAALFGALVIVTGPTVIQPILKNVHPNKSVSTVLKWESILIDPIGALAAVIVYEIIISGANSGGAFTVTAVSNFAKAIFAGGSVGTVMALFLNFMLKKGRLPHYLYNVMALATVFVAFVASDLLAIESGLFAVTIMGMILANLKNDKIREILHFKESLTVLLISILFILLSTNISMEELLLLDWRTVVVLLVILFIVRPLSVFVSAIGSNLKLKEKIFISMIGPRGIVAAAIASIFAFKLSEKPYIADSMQGQLQLLIPLVFLVILGSVIFTGLLSRPMAKMLGVLKEKAFGIGILGATEPGRVLGKYLQSKGIPVVLIDNSHSNITAAKRMKLPTIEGDILEDGVTEEPYFADIGTFLALTMNSQLNRSVCKLMKSELGDGTSYRLITNNEMRFPELVKSKYLLFDMDAEFLKLIEVAHHYPEIKEYIPSSEADFKEKSNQQSEEYIPLLLINKENRVKMITADKNVFYEEGDIMAYFGVLKA